MPGRARRNCNARRGHSIDQVFGINTHKASVERAGKPLGLCTEHKSTGVRIDHPRLKPRTQLRNIRKGNTGEATRLVQQAYQVAEKTGDVGGQLRYMGTVLTHLALKQYDEAERFAKTAMAEARAGDRRIKEIELSLMLAEIATARGHPEQAMAHLEQAATTARAGGVHRLLAEAESDLADAYRPRGDLTQALRHAEAAVAETTAAGSRFTLPGRMKVADNLDPALSSNPAVEQLIVQNGQMGHNGLCPP